MSEVTEQAEVGPSEQPAPPAAAGADQLDPAQMPIEKCFTELETIVTALENDGTSLEEMLRMFERGMKLSSRCSKELKQVERRIQIILETANGETQVKDFRPEAEGNE